jgi:hypothetical protein
MQTKYFIPPIETKEEAVKQFRALVFANHPDYNHNPDATRITQDIIAEYARILTSLTYGSEYARQQEAHTEGRKTTADYVDLEQVIEELRVKIEAILNLGSDIEVELCGLWIWVTGETKKYRKELGKDGLGFKYAAKKSDPSAWFYAGCPSFSRGGYTLEDIRGAHGSKSFHKAEHKQEDQKVGLPAYA